MKLQNFFAIFLYFLDVGQFRVSLSQDDWFYTAVQCIQ